MTISWKLRQSPPLQGCGSARYHDFLNFTETKQSVCYFTLVNIIHYTTHHVASFMWTVVQYYTKYRKQKQKIWAKAHETRENL